MMPQREASEPIQEQADSAYGRYEGNQTFTHPYYETPVGKVYPAQGDNKNILRLITFVIAMVMLLAFAVLCLVFVGGSGGWISFCAASLAIFVVAVVAIDKIK